MELAQEVSERSVLKVLALNDFAQLFNTKNKRKSNYEKSLAKNSQILMPTLE